MKKDNIETFSDQIYSPLKRMTYPSNGIIYIHTDEIWSIDLMDMSNEKISIKILFRYIFVLIDNFSKCTLCIPLKKNNAQTITDEFSKFWLTSKRKPTRTESNRIEKFDNSDFQNFLKINIIHHLLRFADRRSSRAERVIRIIKKLFKLPVF